MSVYRDKREWNRWNEMVLISTHAVEDFNDFADDRAVIQADKKIQSLVSKLKANEAECERLKKALGESINYRECNLNYTQALDALCKAELF